MDWMVGVSQLDSSQRSAIDAVVGSGESHHWIKGFSGTGKTIVLTHIIKRLAADRSRSLCFATYTHALKEMVESGLSKDERSRVTTTTFPGLARTSGRFDVIVADEFQDIRKEHFEVLKQRARSIVFAADFAQRIYNWGMPADALQRAVKPSVSHQLRTIHRINRPVYEFATTIYEDARFAPGRLPTDDREPVHLLKAPSKIGEVRTIVEEAARVARPRKPSAILLPSNPAIKNFLETLSSIYGWGEVPPSGRDIYGIAQADPFRKRNDYLRLHGSPIQQFGSTSGSITASDTRKTVYLMTYHNAKGLEFPFVFLPTLSAQTGLGATELHRRMFFVAATRAKERLYLSYHGRPHTFITEAEALGPSTIKKMSTSGSRY